MSLKQCVRISSANQRNNLGGWFHVIINLQTLIPDKGNFFFPVGCVENTNLNKVPWGRWRSGQNMDLWWRRGRLFVKYAFIWTLIPDNRETIGTMEGLPGNGIGRELNSFI